MTTKTAAPKAATEAAKTMEKTVESTVAATKESVEQVVKATTENYEQALAATRDQIEKATETFAKSYDEMNALGQKNVDAFMKAGTLLTKGAEDISKAYFAFAQTTAENSVKAAQAMFAAKTLKDVVDVQTDYAKSSFDMMVSEGTKINEMTVKVANEAFEPIQSQVNTNVQKVMKTTAA